ncbi:MAG: aldo/keto reductase [bacterium]|nr:aldo/keto reductase [bacterium]
MNIIPEITLNNNNKIPQLGFGTFRIPNDKAGTEAVLYAIKSGYRHIDTAYNYKNERNVAEAIKLSGFPREEFFITTKIGFQDIVALRTREAFFESLENLKTSYVDMVLLHWAATNYVEAYKELLELQKEGYIKNVGVSNFQVHHLEKLKECGLPKPVANQIELHPLFQEKELKGYCLDNNITIEAWSPLGGRDFPIFDNEIIAEIAQKHHKTSAQIVLR